MEKTLIRKTTMEAAHPTRLELRWRAPTEEETKAHGDGVMCDYDLVLQIDPLDIRGEVYDEDGELVERIPFIRASLGGTHVTGSLSQKIEIQQECGDLSVGRIDTPFRDGAHIRWDAEELRLPMYVVCGDWAMRLSVIQ